MNDGSGLVFGLRSATGIFLWISPRSGTRFRIDKPNTVITICANGAYFQGQQVSSILPFTPESVAMPVLMARFSLSDLQAEPDWNGNRHGRGCGGGHRHLRHCRRGAPRQPLTLSPRFHRA